MYWRTVGTELFILGLDPLWAFRTLLVFLLCPIIEQVYSLSLWNSQSFCFSKPYMIWWVSISPLHYIPGLQIHMVSDFWWQCSPPRWGYFLGKWVTLLSWGNMRTEPHYLWLYFPKPQLSIVNNGSQIFCMENSRNKHCVNFK